MPYGSFCNAAVWHILESNFSNRMVYKKVQNSIVAKSRLSHCEPEITKIFTETAIYVFLHSNPSIIHKKKKKNAKVFLA